VNVLCVRENRNDFHHVRMSFGSNDPLARF